MAFQQLTDTFSDRANDCLAYECLGEYDEVMYDSDGRPLFRIWYEGRNDTTGVHYPRDWTAYFYRPVYYLKAPMGMLSNTL